MSSPAFLTHMSDIIGEPVLPMMCVYNNGHINYGKTGGQKKVDQWHFDSVAYVAVIVLSDIEGMKGSFEIQSDR